MRPARGLRLRREPLADLSPEQLSALAGAEQAGKTLLTACCISVLIPTCDC